MGACGQQHVQVVEHMSDKSSKLRVWLLTADGWYRPYEFSQLPGAKIRLPDGREFFRARYYGPSHDVFHFGEIFYSEPRDTEVV